MKTSDKFGIGILLTLTVVIVLLVIGWVMNIVELAHTTEITGMVVVRAIGVFLAPLGGILGWF